jgi:hypothetical protein
MSLHYKPASSLTEQDLAVHPVWRFVRPGELPDEEADESFVVAQAAAPKLGDHASYLIQASYTLDDGTRLPGIVQVDLLDQHVETTAAVLFAAGKSVEPLGGDTAARLGRILKSGPRRPVQWRLSVAIGGEPLPRVNDIPKSILAQAFGLLLQLARLKRMR